MLEIDGSYGEGGGQIVRTALALSTITDKPFRIINIRQNRKNPGLKAQHLACINLLKQICDAKTSDVELGTSSLTYYPKKIKGGKYKVDIGTAGSITLLLQAVLLPLLCAKTRSSLTITGGTCGKFQAPVEYFQHVLIPHIRRFTTGMNCTLQKRGYFPKGGGTIELDFRPKVSVDKTKPFNEFLTQIRSEIKPYQLATYHPYLLVKGVSHASKSLIERQVAQRQNKAAMVTLAKTNLSINIQNEYHDTLSDGSGLTLWARSNDSNDEFHSVIGADSLGEKMVSAEAVGDKAAEDLVNEINSKAVIDKHAADQLLPFLALVKGEIKTSEITEHAKTNMWVIEKFLPVTFTITGNTISVE